MSQVLQRILTEQELQELGLPRREELVNQADTLSCRSFRKLRWMAVANFFGYWGVVLFCLYRFLQSPLLVPGSFEVCLFLIWCFLTSFAEVRLGIGLVGLHGISLVEILAFILGLGGRTVIFCDVMFIAIASKSWRLIFLTALTVFMVAIGLFTFLLQARMALTLFIDNDFFSFETPHHVVKPSAWARMWRFTRTLCTQLAACLLHLPVSLRRLLRGVRNTRARGLPCFPYTDRAAGQSRTLRSESNSLVNPLTAMSPHTHTGASPNAAMGGGGLQPIEMGHLAKSPIKQHKGGGGGGGGGELSGSTAAEESTDGAASSGKSEGSGRASPAASSADHAAPLSDRGRPSPLLPMASRAGARTSDETGSEGSATWVTVNLNENDDTSDTDQRGGRRGGGGGGGGRGVRVASAIAEEGEGEDASGSGVSPLGGGESDDGEGLVDNETGTRAVVQLANTFHHMDLLFLQGILKKRFVPPEMVEGHEFIVATSTVSRCMCEDLVQCVLKVFLLLGYGYNPFIMLAVVLSAAQAFFMCCFSSASFDEVQPSLEEWFLM
ncbi:unnamed protein product [Vitrella brassicaformis CCMP3155]|uniref:Uncharacterized protein n=2 Tax=Vitrella brassicaformis TaxID=1169539 RepID=A0A0G4EEI6_VITBC|nr:unnamed protein product [Vitrella brassicaformis CCMP3155]|eukprot:CEL93789.1 unnamed protein product [Vitrella brassicaformis CCMP3155]